MIDRCTDLKLREYLHFWVPKNWAEKSTTPSKGGTVLISEKAEVL